MRVLQHIPRGQLERLLDLERVLPTKGNAVIEDAEYSEVPRLTRHTEP
jgi:hypothetical protein